MLIDITYFTEGSRQIENASDNPVSQGQRAVNERIEGYISKLEKSYLCAMLGNEVAERMLEDGSEGIFAVIADKLRDSYADYVFYHILRDLNHTATITGLVQLKCANSYVSPVDRMVTAWNRMVDENRQFVDWVNSDGCPLSIRISKNMVAYINSMNL